MKKHLKMIFAISLLNIVISSCGTQSGSNFASAIISSSEPSITSSSSIESSSNSDETGVVSFDENGHWYHNPSNNNELEYEDHHISYAFDGKEGYKKCLNCGYIIKVDVSIADVNEDYFEFYELEDGTYGVGSSSLLPRDSEDKIDLTLPDSHLGKPVTEVVSNGFSKDENGRSYYYNIGTLVIPSTIKTIREFAFSYTQFDFAILRDGIETIEDGAFGYTPSFMFYLPKTVKDVSPTTFYRSNVSKIIIDENNEYYKSVDGVVYSKNGNALCVSPHSYNKDYAILEGTVKINDRVFSGITIDSIVFPSTMKEIGVNVFTECNVKNILLNDGLEIIGDRAFEAVHTISIIQIPNSVYQIGEGAFNYGVGGAKTITLPSSLKVIETNVLSNNYYLEECIINTNVETIKKDAFLGSKKISLRYLGKIAQWNKIALETDWNLIDEMGNLYIKQVHCTDGTLDF